MTEINIKELRDLCTKALLKTGLSQENVDITVDHYLENECSGKASHGMVRVVEAIKKLTIRGLTKEKTEVISDQGNMVIIEGHQNIAPVIGNAILTEAIKRSKQHGICFAAGRNYTANSGSMAYYLRRLTDQGLIGFMSCNSESMVCAPSGKDRLLGTNPIGLGIPSADGNHFIADFATSAIPYGKVLVAQDKSEILPEGCIINNEGNPSIDPQDAFSDGAILPLADYRGFALGLFVELLASLIGAKAIKTDPGTDGLFIIAMDPSKLSDGYAQKVTAILDHIRNSPPAPGHEKVSIPGDRSALTLQQTLNRGCVDVADKTLEKLRGLA